MLASNGMCLPSGRINSLKLTRNLRAGEKSASSAAAVRFAGGNRVDRDHLAVHFRADRNHQFIEGVYGLDDPAVQRLPCLFSRTSLSSAICSGVSFATAN